MTCLLVFRRPMLGPNTGIVVFAIHVPLFCRRPAIFSFRKASRGSLIAVLHFPAVNLRRHFAKDLIGAGGPSRIRHGIALRLAVGQHARRNSG